MLLLSSPGKDHSYGNLQNIKDKQVDQAAEKRATPHSSAVVGRDLLSDVCAMLWSAECT